MPTGKKTSFETDIVKTIQFFNTQKLDYLVLGGVAVGILGEPRFTLDLDLDLFVAKNELPPVLEKLKKAGFKFSKKEVLKNVETFGTFRMVCQKTQIDVILASTQLEQSALKRCKAIKLFEMSMNFPSPEDLILFKIVPGRPKDIVDAETVIVRNRKKLDVPYLKKWAQLLSDEAENYRIFHTLEKLLSSR